MRTMMLTGVAALVMMSVVGSLAQQQGFTRALLQQVELSVPGKEAVTARAEFAPGGTVGRHTHFGEEIGYVLEGAITVEIDGVSKAVKAGETFVIPNGKPHNASNAGAGKATIVVTYIVEKGKPLATPVK